MESVPLGSYSAGLLMMPFSSVEVAEMLLSVVSSVGERPVLLVVDSGRSPVVPSEAAGVPSVSAAEEAGSVLISESSFLPGEVTVARLSVASVPLGVYSAGLLVMPSSSVEVAEMLLSVVSSFCECPLLLVVDSGRLPVVPTEAAEVTSVSAEEEAESVLTSKGSS